MILGLHHAAIAVPSIEDALAFYSEVLGFEVVMPDSPSQQGIDRQNASFCYPVELAHGFFYSLLNADAPLYPLQGAIVLITAVLRRENRRWWLSAAQCCLDSASSEIKM